jgi:hypothetical protein
VLVTANVKKRARWLWMQFEVLVQKRFVGSQRALKTVEDFTEFDQCAAYFDGDP